MDVKIFLRDISESMAWHLAKYKKGSWTAPLVNFSKKTLDFFHATGN